MVMELAKADLLKRLQLSRFTHLSSGKGWTGHNRSSNLLVPGRKGSAKTRVWSTSIGGTSPQEDVDMHIEFPGQRCLVSVMTTINGVSVGIHL